MEQDFEIVFRLLLSVGLGAIVGIEREMTQKAAGLRTHMLVSLGASLFSLISIFYYQIDSARIVAAVVTGVGFIGAGSIIAARGDVHGITTAASLWSVAGIGLAVSSGAYFLSFIATFLVFFILQIKRISRKIKNLKFRSKNRVPPKS